MSDYIQIDKEKLVGWIMVFVFFVLVPVGSIIYYKYFDHTQPDLICTAEYVKEYGSKECDDMMQSAEAEADAARDNQIP